MRKKIYSRQLVEKRHPIIINKFQNQTLFPWETFHEFTGQLMEDLGGSLPSMSQSYHALVKAAPLSLDG